MAEMTAEAKLREALESIVRRFEREDKGGLTTRPGLAWAMYSDAQTALAQPSDTASALEAARREAPRVRPDDIDAAWIAVLGTRVNQSVRQGIADHVNAALASRAAG